jgi:serine protein kinase
MKVKNVKSDEIFNLIDSLEAEEDVTPWEGNLRDYLPMVVENPHLNDSAHARIWRMIESAGIEFDANDTKKKTPRYKFFENDLFGVDETISRLMIDYFKPAAAGSDVARRILLLWGPTSSGKSQFSILLKRGLEKFSRTKEGELYALSDSPMYENPLVVIPQHMRQQIREKYDIHIEGEPSPKISYLLQHQYNGDIWSLPVKRIFLSEQNRVGIGTFQPGDTKSQSQSELVGSVNFSKLEEYGVESHPMAYNFDGELNVANRGMMEFIEMLKVDPKFRHILLTLAQEKQIKVERFPLIYADLVPLAHTNETEYNKFLAKKEEEALHDRLLVRKFPYNLRIDDEVKIYEKLICHTLGFQGTHIAPHTLKVAAMFAVLSRLEEPKNKSVTILQKMHLYNNEVVEGLKQEDVKDLRRESSREGLDGVSPRYIVNRLAACFAKHGVTSITPIDALRSIKDGFESNAKLDEGSIRSLENVISLCVEEYNKIACNEVQKAFFVNFEQEVSNLLENYIDNVGAFLDDKKVENEWGDWQQPDERLMRNVEEQVGVTESGKESFRQEVYRKVLEEKNKNGKFDYQSHPKLKEALQKQLFEERSDVIRLTVSTRNPDPEGLKKVNEVAKVLIEKFEYNAESANELLRYVSSIMSKSS